MKNLKMLAQDALDVQNACNLSGVVKGFSRAIADLHALELYDHPIYKLWADKISSLAGTQNWGGLDIHAAYDEVTKLAKDEFSVSNVIATLETQLGR